MRKLVTALIAVPICAVLALAQNSGSKKAGRVTQSFTGILADANCSATSIPKVTPQRSSTELSGSADRANPAASPKPARDINQPPDVDANLDRTTPTQASPAKPDSASAGKDNAKATATNSTRDMPLPAGEMTPDTNYGSWDKSCFVSPSTSTFVLHMPDGRTLRLDDASNQMIVGRLQSTGRVQSTNKLFRVQVRGTLDGDVLHITDIQI